MMTIDEQTELIVRIVDKMVEMFADLIDDIPRYLIFEASHPKKKPRGSIRRRRRQNENTSA